MINSMEDPMRFKSIDEVQRPSNQEMSIASTYRHSGSKHRNSEVPSAARKRDSNSLIKLSNLKLVNGNISLPRG